MFIIDEDKQKDSNGNPLFLKSTDRKFFACLFEDGGGLLMKKEYPDTGEQQQIQFESISEMVGLFEELGKMRMDHFNL